jgi:hypothetical protein
MVKTYDPKKVRLVIAGVIATGLADGNSIIVEKNEPNLTTEHVGSQGEVSRTMTTNRTALLKLMVKSTSPFNEKLYLIANTLNAAKFPIQLENSSDLKFLAVGSECWVKVIPNREFGQEEQMREWQLFISDYAEKEG